MLIALVGLLAGCAGSAKLLPDGKYAIATTVGDSWDRSTTIVGEYTCPTKDGKPEIGKCQLAANAAPPDRVHGQTIGGQAFVGAMGGTGAALINGNTARSVAERGRCPAGAVCNSTINNVQSVANALNENKVKIGVEAGGAGAPAACAATSTCGK